MTLSQVAILELSGLQDLRKVVKSDPVVKSGKLAEDKISSGGKHRGPCGALGSSLSPEATAMEHKHTSHT